MTPIPAAWNTASNGCVKLASRSRGTNFARAPASPQVHEQVAGLLDDPGLDRVLRGAQDPDAPTAVLGHRKDVHLRVIEQVSGEEAQRQDPLRLGSQELRPPGAVPARSRAGPRRP